MKHPNPVEQAALDALRDLAPLEAIAIYLKQVENSGGALHPMVLRELIEAFEPRSKREFHLKLKRRPGNRKRQWTDEYADDAMKVIRVERRVRSGIKQAAALAEEGIARATFFRLRDRIFPNPETLQRYLERVESQEIGPGT